MDILLTFCLFSGSFNISLNWKSYKEVQVLWCTQKAVINLLKKRIPVQPLQIYPVMLWSKFSSFPTLTKAGTVVSVTSNALKCTVIIPGKEGKT